MAVKLGSKLPKDDGDLNGLNDIHADLVAKPKESRWALVQYSVTKTEVEHGHDTEIRTPVVGVEWVEPVTNPRDLELVQRLMERSQAMRTHRDPARLDHAAELDRLDYDPA